MIGGDEVAVKRLEPIFEALAPGQGDIAPNRTSIQIPRLKTYAAIKLRIDNWRWAGVPFYLRSGKRMPRRTTTIVIRFKTPPLSLFATYEADPILRII